MVRSDTWSGWPIGTLLSPAIAPQSSRGGTHGQACRLLRFAEFALDLSRLEALRGDGPEAWRRRHHLACRFRLGVRRLRPPSAARAAPAAPGPSPDGSGA